MNLISLNPDAWTKWIYNTTHPDYNSAEARYLRDRRAQAMASAPEWMIEEARMNDLLSERAAEGAETDRAALEALRLGHYECEDRWYSCPKSDGGCANEYQGVDCTCGADSHNARLDALIRRAVGRTNQ